MEAETVNIQNAAPANPTVRSIMLNDSGSLSIKADTITAEGYSATGGSTGELLATKKLVITRGSDSVDDFNGLDQRAAVIAAEGTQTTFGTETADVSVEGTTKVNKDADVTFNGKTVTLTASGEDAALYSQGRTRVGSDQTEETTLRGRVDALALAERPFGDKKSRRKRQSMRTEKSMWVLRRQGPSLLKRKRRR